ncbi:MAG: aminotransferase class I/II-fold pyridoxal phosphate-dependent enzyme [Lachnospiraceae bacterium]|nr:aminotransferase class I/II-fold pyridoxal phosphate-dependent enzyme [Lachnospiraceae bacterium]
MKPYLDMTKEELLAEKVKVEAEYKGFEEANLSLNMARGKPSPEQLDLSLEMLNIITPEDYLKAENGADCRNYGELDGIPEAKRLVAELMGCRPDMVCVCGNASLSIMYDNVSRSVTHGIMGNTPWKDLKEEVKFLCPVPGYDRHFAICESLGIKMINIPMTPDGPNMDMVEDYVSKDPYVKGIWCVPKYSNPQGYSYSDETVRRFANLNPAARDFRIYWDNAYFVHSLYEDYDKKDHILNIFDECEKIGTEDMVFEFCSTSKVTFAGAGIAAMAASDNNIKDWVKWMGFRTIGFDKLNQLRHVRFIKDKQGLIEHMRKHAAILRPKFELCDKKLSEGVRPLKIGDYIMPNGGYFISFEALPGTARRIVKLAKDAGVVLTAAGAPFPYKKDPKDSVIRLAPSFPSLAELDKAMDVFMCCVKLAAIEKLLTRF